MRAYFFGNMYISQIQHGIQAKHVGDEMVLKYFPIPTIDDVGHEQCWQPSPQAGMLGDWMQNHKTVILLNGGFGENIEELESFFEGTLDAQGVTRLSEVYDGAYSPYPFAIFCESDEALGGAATSFGVILPPKIYEGAAAMRKLKRLRRDDPARMNFEFQKILTVTVPSDEYKGATKVVDFEYNQWEVELMERLGTFRLA